MGNVSLSRPPCGPCICPLARPLHAALRICYIGKKAAMFEAGLSTNGYGWRTTETSKKCNGT
eukprot:612342-Pyramimonas_sp.AAC.1